MPGSPATWVELGFAVTDGVVALGRCSVRPGTERLAFGVVFSEGPGERPDTARRPTEWLGIPLVPIDHPTANAETPAVHPNGVHTTDHIVVMAPDLDAAVAAIEATGWEVRRERPSTIMGVAVVQLFVWAGTALLEIVCATEPNEFIHEPVLWGVSFAAADLDATVEHLGDRIGTPRDAVQEGRRIATVRRRGTDLGLEIAIMSPHGSDRR